MRPPSCESSLCFKFRQPLFLLLICFFWPWLGATQLLAEDAPLSRQEEWGGLSTGSGFAGGIRFEPRLADGQLSFQTSGASE